MLIDHTYFAIGPRQIRNATLGRIPASNSIPTPNEIDICRMIEAYIAEYQEEYLDKVLGDNNGNKVHTYLVCLDEDDEPKHLENIDAVCNRLKESFADYVFFHILRDINSQATDTGLVRIKSGNEHVPPIRRQVSVWNSMVERHRRFNEWCRTSECRMTGIEISAELLTKVNQFNL